MIWSLLEINLTLAMTLVVVALLDMLSFPMPNFIVSFININMNCIGPKIYTIECLVSKCHLNVTNFMY